MKTPCAQGPIGVFDSGVGGLSILGALWRHLPNERYVYVADGAHCPYGDRIPGEVQAISLAIGDYLAGADVKLIVVACNTASATALTALRAHLPEIPIVGMVPALKPAAKLTRTGTVGVIATEATISGRLYREVLERHASGIRVISQACPGLVERIEEGDLESSATESLLRRCLAPILRAQADVVVMGCTHYPFVTPLLERILGPAVTLLEPSDAVALQVRRVLMRDKLASTALDAAQTITTFGTTGDPLRFRHALRALMHVDPDVAQLTWRGGCLMDTAAEPQPLLPS